ncbi:MAG: hypothetical protein A4E65_02895 [Syntrophorhabdus sp. PtaU1.Bin153]|nr:MAG: hypothetical protein A4E65_02895 [Syntrophorhabdus sp. PtaU1.Bin153]
MHDPSKIVNTPSSLEGKDEHKLEYIKEIIALAGEDIKIVMYYVTLSFAMLTLFITQISIKTLAALPLGLKMITCFGLFSCMLSAFFFFIYIRHLHITKMKIVRCIVSLDVIRVRELWAGEHGVWQQHKAKYNAGKLFLVLAAATLSLIVLTLILFPSGSQ